jgi:hypothetical protein
LTADVGRDLRVATLAARNAAHIISRVEIGILSRVEIWKLGILSRVEAASPDRGDGV